MVVNPSKRGDKEAVVLTVSLIATLESTDTTKSSPSDCKYKSEKPPKSEYNRLPRIVLIIRIISWILTKDCPAELESPLILASVT